MSSIHDGSFTASLSISALSCGHTQSNIVIIAFTSTRAQELSPTCVSYLLAQTRGAKSEGTTQQHDLSDFCLPGITQSRWSSWVIMNAESSGTQEITLLPQREALDAETWEIF